VKEQGSKLVDRTLELPRRSRGAPFFEKVWQDVRYGVRGLCRSPGFTIAAILTLMLGIGGTTAIFTVVDRILLLPLAGPDPSRVVVLMQGTGDQLSPLTSIPKFMMWRDQPKIFEETKLGGIPGSMRVNLLGGDHPQQYRATKESMNFFSLYGIPFAKGRGFVAEEDSPGGPPVAVLTNDLWRNRFGSDPNIVGKSINLDDTEYTVVGVMKPVYGPDVNVGDIILPLQADPNSANQGNDLVGVARLRAGVTMAQAIAATKVMADRFHERYPAMMGPKQTFTLKTAREVVVAGVSTALWTLLAAVGLVLLIACTNIASLMLARATVRRREVSIRMALGAGPARIVRQILTESMVVSGLGGAIGLLVGFFGVRLLLAVNPVMMPRLGEHNQAIKLDWRIVLFAVGVSLLAGAISGVAPAIKASRTDLAASINEGGTHSGIRGSRTRSLLVVCETALAMILLVGAALLIRSFHDLTTVNPGFQSHNILTMDMSMMGPRFKTTAAVAKVVGRATQLIENLPGVETAAAACCMPLDANYGLPFNIEGVPPTKGPYNGLAVWSSISPGYFKVFRIPLLRGRAFTLQDDGKSEPVVIINEAMAKRFWPKGDEIGVRITIGRGLGPPFADPPREIVGVVGDVRDTGLNNEPFPTMFVPIAQVADAFTQESATLIPLQWMIRTRVAPYSLRSEIQDQLRIASGGLPVGAVRTMDEVVAHSVAYQKFSVLLLSTFAGIGLLLAAVGAYGVVAYSVQQRTQEIGIRMTLGASSQDVRAMVVRQGMLLAVAGIVLGVGGGLSVTRVMRNLLYSVGPRDPLMFAATAILLAVVALVACYIPARRASRVDPLVALRYQ
jgi:putative ABC transport system permease protein